MLDFKRVIEVDTLAKILLASRINLHANEYSADYLNWESSNISALISSWNGYNNDFDYENDYDDDTAYNIRSTERGILDLLDKKYAKRIESTRENFNFGCRTRAPKTPRYHTAEYSNSKLFSKNNDVLYTYFKNEHGSWDHYFSRVKKDYYNKNDFRIYIDPTKTSESEEKLEKKGHILVPIEITDGNKEVEKFKFDELKFARFSLNISKDKSKNICKLTVKYENEVGSENYSGIPLYFYAYSKGMLSFENKNIDCNLID